MFCGTCGSTEPISLPNILSTEPCRGLDDGLCGTCQKLEVLASQISDTLKALQRLVSKHRKLRTKRNLTHSPILNRVPPEIIASIFQHLIPGFNPSTGSDSSDCQIEKDSDAPTPFTLGAVCRTWRSIAWSTPQLWRSISISLDLVSSPESVELAQQWLLRSGDMLLSIHIHSDIDFADEENHLGSDMISSCRPLIETINHCSKRWGHLHLDVPHFMFSYFCGDGHGAPRLRKLCVQPSSYNHSAKFRFRLQGERPRPKEVVITHRRFKAVDIAWDNVTHVQATGFHVSDCLELLRRAPQLIYCKLLDVDISESRAKFPIPDSPLTHKLHRLHFQTSDYAAGLFFVYVTLPCLIHLDCKLKRGSRDYASLRSFFSRSACSLQEFFITDIEFDDKDLIQILNTSPSIIHLVLTPPSYSESITPTFLLESLARTSYDDDADLGTFLPKLEHLEFYVWQDCPWKRLTDIFGYPDDVQNSRRRPLNFLKVVRVQDPTDMMKRNQTGDYIERDVRRRILELKKAGIQVELFTRCHRRN